MSRRPNSSRGFTLVLGVLAALALVAPATGSVGAVFTDGQTIDDQNVTTATIFPLTGGTVALVGTTATVAWDTPSQSAEYVVQRTVGGVATTIAPPIGADGARTSFADPLVATPSDGSCAVGWALASSDRCVPAGTVSYRIAHTVSGWAPASALSLSIASTPSPTVTTTSTHVEDVFRLGVQITNPTAVAKTYTVRFPTRVGVGVLVNVVPALVGHSDDGWYATMDLGPGETKTGEIRWRGAASGDVIALTTSDGVAPRVETTVVVP